MKIILISGMSGAGRSTMLSALESHDFYCIDNLPIEFLEDLIDKHLSHQKVAVSLTVSGLQSSSTHITPVVEHLRKKDVDLQLYFLNASTEVLLRRYDETGRPHPMTAHDSNASVEECIEEERRLLKEIAALSDTVINTDGLSPYQLREEASRSIGGKENTINLTIQSFGYKKGLPVNSDFVFDVRSLPNPYWNTELRSHNGQDSKVIAFMQQQPQSAELIESIVTFLQQNLKNFKPQRRKYITVSIGCTGGFHRSVYVTEEVFKRLQDSEVFDAWEIQKSHRDI